MFDMNYTAIGLLLTFYLFSSFLQVLTANVKLTPFTYPKLYKIVDRYVGMDYFSKKLGIDNYASDYVVLKRTQPYLDWQNEYEAIKESVRNIGKV